MQVKILSEYGYDAALFGLGLSHGVTSGYYFTEFAAVCKPEDIVPTCKALGVASPVRPIRPSTYTHMESVAQKLAGKGNGHDKFLRQICVWLDITAPRYLWPEMDQYKFTVTQSESTMHTIHKRDLTPEDFELDTGLDLAFPESQMDIDRDLRRINAFRSHYLETKDKKYWRAIIQLLPQSYLQRRILTCNYETLRNIITQRTGHKLSEWAVFIDAIKNQCEHPELLP